MSFLKHSQKYSCNIDNWSILGYGQGICLMKQVNAKKFLRFCAHHIGAWGSY